MNKVYCEDCSFSEMKIKWVNKEQWCQTWWCKNPKFAIRENPVNKPFLSKKKCMEINRNNDCLGFFEKTFWKRNKETILLISILSICIIGLVLIGLAVCLSC